MNAIRKAFCAAPFLLLAAAPAAAGDSPAAVVFMYHRFGESAYPSTNTPLDQFEAHIAYLKSNGFAVLPLEDVAAALAAGTALPPKAAAITVDDAYASVLTEAWPRLRDAGLPFTVFVATAAVDRGFAGLMSWDDIRRLRDAGVGIGAHSHGHAHYPSLSAADLRADLAAMKESFSRALGAVPALFAYPYGEAGAEDMRIVREAGFMAAFGQHSGPAYAEADAFYLPRFALNQAYGGPERFALVANARPLRAVNLRPDNPVIAENPPVLSFDVALPPAGLSAVSCFGPGGAPVPVRVEGARVTASPAAPFPAGRARMNCTLNAGGGWHWFGTQFIAGGQSEGVPVHARYQ